MSGVDVVVVWLASGVCSQQPAHSFWLDGRQLPLCARDLGLFGAFLLASPLMTRASRSRCWLLGLLPLAVDGFNSFAADTIGVWLYPPANVFRLATGVLAGVCLAALLAGQLPGWWLRGAGPVLARTLAMAARGPWPRLRAGFPTARGCGQPLAIAACGPWPWLRAGLPTVRGCGQSLAIGSCVPSAWLLLIAPLGLVSPSATAGLVGLLGAGSLFATANRLARPALTTRTAWLLALPELAALAAAKQSALLLLR